MCHFCLPTTLYSCNNHHQAHLCLLIQDAGFCAWMSARTGSGFRFGSVIETALPFWLSILLFLMHVLQHRTPAVSFTLQQQVGAEAGSAWQHQGASNSRQENTNKQRPTQPTKNNSADSTQPPTIDAVQQPRAALTTQPALKNKQTAAAGRTAPPHPQPRASSTMKVQPGAAPLFACTSLCRAPLPGPEATTACASATLVRISCHCSPVN